MELEVMIICMGINKVQQLAELQKLTDVLEALDSTFKYRTTLFIRTNWS